MAAENSITSIPSLFTADIAFTTYFVIQHDFESEEHLTVVEKDGFLDPDFEDGLARIYMSMMKSSISQKTKKKSVLTPQSRMGCLFRKNKSVNNHLLNKKLAGDIRLRMSTKWKSVLGCLEKGMISYLLIWSPFSCEEVERHVQGSSFL